MGEARKHHFISRCYLQGFTHNGAKNSQLFVVSVAEGRTFECTAANVAHVRDFNRLEGFPAGALDNALGKFEGLACKALRLIEDTGTLPDSEAWTYIMNLAALFAVRHPAQRENVRKFMAEISERIFDLMLASRDRYQRTVKQATEAGYVPTGREVSFEEMKDFHQRKEYEIAVSTNFHVEQEMQMLDAALATFAQRNWAIYLAAPGAGTFVTSDRPLMLLDLQQPTANRLQPVGHAMLETMVVFPLSKSALAVGVYEEHSAPLVMRAATKATVAHFNGITALYAYREVYGASPKFPVKLGENISIGGDLLATIRRIKPRF